MPHSPYPQIMNGSLADTSSARHLINAQSGELVYGTLSALHMQLLLLDKEGEIVRQLTIDNGLNTQDFAFMVGNSAQYTLEIRNSQAGNYRLSIQYSPPLPQNSAPFNQLQSPSLQALATAPNTEAFWQQMQQNGCPLVESIDTEPHKVLLTFLYRGAQKSVILLGAPAEDHAALQRLGQTDVWYRSYLVPRTLRLSYRFAPDAPLLAASQQHLALIAVAQRDPLNPHCFPLSSPDLFNGESTILLDQSPELRWLHQATLPTGKIASHRIHSPLLGNTRRVQLYRPEGCGAGNGLLVMFDGERQGSAKLVVGILDQLQAAGKIPPTALILINNADRASRSKELPPNPLFARFMAEELMPWAHQQGIDATAQNTIICGSSFGGLAASWVALQYPQLFGNVYAQSASYWWYPEWENPESLEEPGWLMRQFASQPRAPLRFHLEAGIYEAGGSHPILESVRHFRDVLQAKGYPVSHQEFASGHDAYNWFACLGSGLIRIFAKTTSTQSL